MKKLVTAIKPSLKKYIYIYIIKTLYYIILTLPGSKWKIHHKIIKSVYMQKAHNPMIVIYKTFLVNYSLNVDLEMYFLTKYWIQNPSWTVVVKIFINREIDWKEQKLNIVIRIKFYCIHLFFYFLYSLYYVVNV